MVRRGNVTTARLQARRPPSTGSVIMIRRGASEPCGLGSQVELTAAAGRVPLYDQGEEEAESESRERRIETLTRPDRRGEGKRSGPRTEGEYEARQRGRCRHKRWVGDIWSGWRLRRGVVVCAREIRQSRDRFRAEAGGREVRVGWKKIGVVGARGRRQLSPARGWRPRSRGQRDRGRDLQLRQRLI